MKPLKFGLLGLAIIAGIGIITSLSSCKKTVVDAVENESSSINLKYYEIPEEELALKIALMTPGVLDSAEIMTLNHMREEELLARDVYMYFKTIYNRPIFKNIMNSENAHTNAIKKLINKYNLNDPAASHQPGNFTNTYLQALYDQFISQGSISLTDALYVGATIEDLDIFDIQNHISQDVDNADILMVLNHLLKGSKNHLRAFYAQLSARGVTYIPQYISQEELDAIIH